MIDNSFIRLIIEMHNGFWADKSYFVAYIISLVLVIKNRKEWTERQSCVIPYSILYIILVLYNPVFVFFAYKVFFSDISESIRVWTMLPVYFVMLIALVNVLDKKSASKRFLAIVLLVFIAITEGSTIEGVTGLIVKADSQYKVNKDAVDAVDALRKDKKEGITIVMHNIKNGNGNYTVGGDFFVGVYHYDSDVKLVKYYDNYEDITKEFVVDHNIEYAIVKENPEMVEHLVEMGGEVINTANPDLFVVNLKDCKY